MASSQAALDSQIVRSYAGLGRRIGAHLIDVTIAFLVVAVVAVTMRILQELGLWTAHAGLETSPEELWGALGFGAKLSVLFAFVIAQGVIYRVLFEASAWQATFGKRWLNIYVTDDECRRISISRSFGRWIAMWLFGSFGGSLISVASIAWTENRKAFHDYAAKTLVLNGRPARVGTLEPWRVAAGFVLPFAWIMGTFLATL